MSDLVNLVRGLRVAGSQLDSFGHALVARAGLLNVWTAALLGGAFLLDRALARRARASLRIALYAPVGLRVLLPQDFSFHLASAPRVDALLAPLAQIRGSGAAEELPTRHAPSAYALAAVVYVAVAVFLASRAALARVRLARALAGAEPAPVVDPNVPCPVVQHDDLGPMAVGLLAPRIVLPRRLLAPGQESALACVLRHESAHLRRGDAWLSAAMQVLAIVAWPIAPLWLAMARVRQLVELACDEAALAGADAPARRLYGHALLDLAEWRSFAVARIGTAAGELHFGSTLRARIEALASQRHWPVAVQAVVLSALPAVLLVACAATTPANSTVPTTSAPAQAGADEGYGYQFDVDPAKGGPAPVAAGSPSVPVTNADGRVSPEAIQSTVRAHFPAMQACYSAGLAKNPKLAGIVSVKFVFGEDGVTREAADEGSTLADKTVVGCVVDELRKITYPKAHAGIVTVVYPIQFTP